MNVIVVPGTNVQPTKSRHNANSTTVSAQAKSVVQPSSQLQSIQQQRSKGKRQGGGGGILKQSSTESGEERSSGGNSSGARRKDKHEQHKRYAIQVN